MPHFTPQCATGTGPMPRHNKTAKIGHSMTRALCPCHGMWHEVGTPCRTAARFQIVLKFSGRCATLPILPRCVTRCGTVCDTACHGVTPRHAVCQPPLRMLSLGVKQRNPFAAYICSKSVQPQLNARSSQVDRAREDLLWPILTLPASYSGGRAFKPVSREVKVSFTISTSRQ